MTSPRRSCRPRTTRPSNSPDATSSHSSIGGRRGDGEPAAHAAEIMANAAAALEAIDAEAQQQQDDGAATPSKQVDDDALYGATDKNLNGDAIAPLEAQEPEMREEDEPARKKQRVE